MTGLKAEGYSAADVARHSTFMQVSYLFSSHYMCVYPSPFMTLPLSPSLGIYVEHLIQRTWGSHGHCDGHGWHGLEKGHIIRYK